MKDWGQLELDHTLPHGGHSGQDNVHILVAAKPPYLDTLVNLFSSDARFNLVASASSAPDLAAKLVLQPEVLLVQADLYADADAYAKALGDCGASLYTILPATAPPSLIDALRHLPAQQELFSGEPNLPELAAKIYAVTSARRQIKPAARDFSLDGVSARTTVTGWRSIAVWSQQGGTGRSTLATALALEAAERHLPTLLVGLGAPDVIPLRLGFRSPHPNLLDWQEHATTRQLHQSVRRFDLLDVLPGFPNQSALDAYTPLALDGHVGLPALANTGAHAGYAVVIFDVSSQALAAPAISAANTLLLVSLPTLDGVLATAEATRLANGDISQQHHIPMSGIHLILNRVRDSMLTPHEFMRSLSRMDQATPPLAGVVVDDSRIDSAHRQCRPGFNVSDSLRQTMKYLGDALFALPARHLNTPTGQTNRSPRVWQLGPLRIRH